MLLVAKKGAKRANQRQCRGSHQSLVVFCKQVYYKVMLQ